MNLVLAAFLISIGFMIGLPAVVDDTVTGEIRDSKIQIVSVLPESPAAQANLEIGDTILAIDGQHFSIVDEIVQYNAQKGTNPIELTILREGEEKSVELSLAIVDEENLPKMGAGLVKTGIVSYSWYLAIWEGVKTTVFFTWQIILAFANLIKNLIITQTVSVDIAGPVGIAVLTGQVAKLGFIYILQFTALLSINLAIINFFPFPALDGGRILFLIIEKIRHKPITQKIEAAIHNIGFMILILLMIVVTFHDFSRYRESIFNLFHRIIGS